MTTIICDCLFAENNKAKSESWSWKEQAEAIKWTNVCLITELLILILTLLANELVVSTFSNSSENQKVIECCMHLRY